MAAWKAKVGAASQYLNLYGRVALSFFCPSSKVGIQSGMETRPYPLHGLVSRRHGLETEIQTGTVDRSMIDQLQKFHTNDIRDQHLVTRTYTRDVGNAKHRR